MFQQILIQPSTECTCTDTLNSDPHIFWGLEVKNEYCAHTPTPP